MKTRSMLLKLSKQFPKWLAKKNHDHVGLMTGKLPEDVHKVLLCLDFDEIVLPMAKEIKPDLILTHHPLVFGTRSIVFKYDPMKKELCDAIDSVNIPVYSMHTNFDEGKGGMNDALTRAMHLKDIYTPEGNHMMRIGYLENEMSVEEASEYIKKCLNVDYGLLVKGNDKPVKKIGIIGGGGSRSYEVAMAEGCDLYISGDAPHYVRRDIIRKQFNYLDLPHEIEKIFMPTMKEILLGMDPTLDITIIDHETLPKVI